MSKPQSPAPSLPPARLRPDEAASLIGCHPHDIPVLVKAGLLKPLGRVPPNAVKYFSRRKVMELCDDDAWLARVTEAIIGHWRVKNGRRRCSPSSGLPARREQKRHLPGNPALMDGISA
jgi:hypothetical protein